MMSVKSDDKAGDEKVEKSSATAVMIASSRKIRNAAGHVTQTTDALGNVATSTPDPRGNVLQTAQQVIDIDGTAETVQTASTYDANDFDVGKRNDLLRRQKDGGFKIAAREIFLDQNVLLAKNLTTFF